MSIFELSSNMGHEFLFSDKVQPSYKGIIIPQAALHSLHGIFGEFVMQGLQMSDYNLWYNSYRSKQRYITHAGANVPLIELCIVLEKSVSYTLDGEIGKIHQRTGQFNIFNSDCIDSHVQFEKSSFYISFDIHAKPGLLAFLNAHFPKLMEPLMRAIENNKNFKYFEKSVYLTDEMMQLIDYIFILLKRPILNTHFLNIAVAALFAHAIALKAQTNYKGMSFKKKQDLAEQLHSVRQALFADKAFMGLEHYGKIADMSGQTLNKYFKECFNSNIEQAWRINNMANAMKDVKNTGMTIEDIALKFGFSGGDAFSKAFKKIYNFPPSNLRNKK